MLIWYLDADEDGFGDPDSTDIDCDQPSGYVSDATDCDDTMATTNPDALEYCDEVDNDCDGDTDEDDAVNVTVWYSDADDDGYGDPDDFTESCDVPSGYVDNDEDCDGSDGAINPAATEVCDGQDNDCDELIDNDDDDVDSDTITTWYVDEDEDGYGSEDDTQDSCDAPSGFVSNNEDCDDDDDDINPDGEEVCDQDENE